MVIQSFLKKQENLKQPSLPPIGIRKRKNKAQSQQKEGNNNDQRGNKQKQNDNNKNMKPRAVFFFKVNLIDKQLARITKTERGPQKNKK